ncbi:MAG: peptide chain release factor N(5)-glutamine methyltransferase [Lutibacter sp.]|nr:peptide chain release factor N(5)-glutamine methyltransferase [Lutibacter sp.]MBP9601090.1 peptide chain release factor N(5)-glutamine methyltransferase [Lutibacter sp.]
MQLLQFKNHFFSELSNIYPTTEIQSFFKLLIEFKLGLNRIETALQPAFEINTENEVYLQSALQELKNHIPIQYIIGKTEFYGLTFRVTNDVLIPRPETEELVNWIVQENDQSEKLKILDIGTGSGCIAISLAKLLPNSEVTAIDISSEALKIAKENALLNNVTIHFLEKNILETTELPHNFDIIVSNPPYVRELEKEQMHPNVLRNEPHLALFVKDNNPLLFYDKIADLAKSNLTTNGTLYFEINQYLGSEMKELLQHKGFTTVELRKDLYDVDRMLKAIL